MSDFYQGEQDSDRFRNRLLVLVDWAWQYISYDRAVRLIDADAPPAGIMDAVINGS